MAAPQPTQEDSTLPFTLNRNPNTKTNASPKNKFNIIVLIVTI